jgi:Spy/CpxP family protein refolding chaperone
MLGAMTAAMAIAQTTPAAQTPVKAHVTKELIQAVDLTKAQKHQAKTIRQATRQQAQPLAQQLKQNRQSLTAAIQAGDTAQIQQLSATVGTLTGQVLAVRSAGKAQFYALLTPDQKAKAAAFEQKAHEVPPAKGE